MKTDSVLLDLETEFEEVMDELRLGEDIKSSARSFLAILKEKSSFTYTHSLRVGLLARRIGRFMHLPENALFLAGIFHDLGKSQTPLSTLHKTGGWSSEDAKIMEDHVMDSYRILRDKFDFSAQECGRVLAIADVYDAMHRKNNKFEEGESITEEQIREKMLEFNKDRKELIEELYNVGILERGVIPTDNPEEDLYRQAWDDNVEVSTAKETARLVMLAAALEPISDKAGCTTRFTDISRHLKLEYFITGAINLGSAFESLALKLERLALGGIYDYALQAQQESLRNRSGGRINQGIIELLIPIVSAQYMPPRAKRSS